MHQLARCLLRTRKFPPAAAALTPTATPVRPLSVLSTVPWSKSDRCQFIQPPPLWPGLRIHAQQVRFRRHDRASAFSKPRPKTKKQRQTYNRKLKRIDEEKAKHNPPGFLAGPRRQFIRDRWQQLIDQAAENNGKELVAVGDDDNEEYGIGDALMEDMLGNTAHLTSQPTPEPVYLGHMHQKYYDAVADQMDRYRRALEAQAQSGGDLSESQVLDLSTGEASLPSDESISKVLRAYRDRHGTRSRPIGIAMALEHVLKDLGVPIVAFGEYTYTTLLTCCRTPTEARRIMKLMNDQRHPISAYSWSILVDIHAKLGDFQGCVEILKEMASEGIPPTQAAYTSLLAACYKVCNDGRIPHPIRAQAGEIGWNHWQEMRIVGIEADAMAYGAIIRLCAARGQAERALNLLEEMTRFDVKPTTLCFSGALRAVAKSHEIGVRFERGWSRKQLRRELFTAHHGKMARQIVIMAENAEVEQDESFVSALMLCAAAAGDSATAKAIYLASEVRRMDHLRTIGPNATLQAMTGGKSQPPRRGGESQIESKLESSLDKAGNELSSKNGGATMSTVEPHTLQLQGSPNDLMESFGEREYGRDTRTLSALLRSCGQAMTETGLGTMWAGRTNQGYLCENSLRLIATRSEPNYSKTSIPDELSTKVGISSLRRYDENEPDNPVKKGAARKKFRGLYLDDDAIEVIDEYANAYYDGRADDDIIDNPEIQSFLKPEFVEKDIEPTFGTLGVSESVSETLPDEDDGFSTENLNNFDIFFHELKEEAKAEGLDHELSEEEARELFLMLQDEFVTSMNDLQDAAEYTESDHVNESSPVIEENEDESLVEARVRADNGEATYLQDGLSSTAVATIGNADLNTTEVTAVENSAHLRSTEPHHLVIIKELQDALPGMPIGRLKRVASAFESTLGYPSLLTLVPLLRESLPDNLTLGRLKTMNMRNAQFVLEKAEDEGLIDQSLLNGMLQAKTSASSLDEAQLFHKNEFRRHNLKPTAYSDRLVFQMLVDNNRLSRALDFKRKIESEKRTLDLPSYGTIIDYFARHHQLGSAMMALKECFAQHACPPSERYLSTTRLLARRINMEGELKLDSIIGEDPAEWIKHGERHLKRERSRNGRRNVQMAYNRILG